MNGGIAGYPFNDIDVQSDNKKDASVLSLKSISEYESEFESESLSDSMDSKMIRNKSAGVEGAGFSNRNIFVEPNPPAQPLQNNNTESSISRPGVVRHISL